jgi:catechol 2,3-dioxygenase-like lactoylglutathione lyase family enzyme
MAIMRSIAPIFPTADLQAAQAHYEALGFTVRVHGGGYGSAARDGVTIHFREDPASAPPPSSRAERGACYIGVDDVDALHAEWTAAGVGETGEVFDPGFGVREAAHTDPDGNLVRFGSPTAGP